MTDRRKIDHKKVLRPRDRRVARADRRGGLRGVLDSLGLLRTGHHDAKHPRTGPDGT